MTIEKISRMNEIMISVLTVVYLHFLWMLFSLVGLGIFGVGPASYAMMKYYDRWLRLKERPPITKSFVLFFKERYRQSLLFSWIYLVIVSMIAVNLFATASWYIQVANVLILIVIQFIFTHVYTIMAATKFKTMFEIIRGSALLGLGYLHYSILAWTLLIGGYVLLGIYFPAILIFAGAGLAGLILAYPGKLILQTWTPTEETETELKEMLV